MIFTEADQLRRWHWPLEKEEISLADLIYFQNGAYLPHTQAVVNVDSALAGRGMGVFEGIRGYWNDEEEELYLFRLQEHFERQLRSAKIARMRIPYTVSELVDIACEVVRRNGFREDVHMRPLAYKASEQITSKALVMTALEDGYAISVNPMGRYMDVKTGIRCAISSWRRVDDNMAPARAKITGIYINSALAKTEAVERGYDECIFLNAAGKVAEGSGENLFLVKDGKLITPSADQNILEGITRRTVIELVAQEWGREVEQRAVDRTELYVADEVFLTGSGAEITPVIEIDERSIGDGTIGSLTSKLQHLYSDVIHGKRKEYFSWLTPCYKVAKAAIV